ncbi:MAG: hypothetical protein IKS75_01820 [Clostridiales bacterium]|nr:hypothetical protein [Clostridiales bacterium]
MVTSKKQSKLYSFYKAVVTVPAFMACFYLLIVCFIATYRLISDIGSVRVLFLNPVLIVLLALAAVFALGIYVFKTQKMLNKFSKLEDTDTFARTMRIFKVLIFIECLVFVAGVNCMRQNVDQLSVQQAAYSYSWGETETFVPPGYMSIYPNNLGMSVALYLMSLVAGHYNNLFIMLIYAVLVPFIYSDLAYIGGRFGLTKKSQIMVMTAGLLFLPLQAKTLIIYGDVPGLFFAVKAMRYASDIAYKKPTIRKALAVIAFPAIACVLKNNFIIFAIAITIYLAAELLKQKRTGELYIPLAVIVFSVLLNVMITWIVGAIIGQTLSSGASKWSWIAMGMQEEAGMYNGYNAYTYYLSGFDATAQAEAAKSSIAGSLKGFAAEPNYAIGFYTRKVLIQWSDPTHCAFEFQSRNVYLADDVSPLMWFLASPAVIGVASSFLKIFQLLMFAGSSVTAVKAGRGKTGSPALLLLMTFIGGYVFHLIWEAAPFYTLAYMVMLIPTGVAGLISIMKKISRVKFKELSKVQYKPGAEIVYFFAGVLVFLFASAGLGTVKNLLINGRKEYKNYYSQEMDQSRNPVAEGYYYLTPAGEGYENAGFEVELIRYAGKYRMRLITSDPNSDIYLAYCDGELGADWFSYDESEVFVILRNDNGTYTICRGVGKALMVDPADGKMKVGDMDDYSFTFGTADYDNFISENPDYTWLLEPAN